MANVQKWTDSSSLAEADRILDQALLEKSEQHQRTIIQTAIAGFYIVDTEDVS